MARGEGRSSRTSTVTSSWTAPPASRHLDGHSHPDVVKAIVEQSQKFLHMSGTDFYYEPQVRLGEIVQIAPMPGPHRSFFANSGTEANEAAIKLARYYTKRPNIIAFFGAFHGRTMGSLSLTASKLRSGAVSRRSCRACFTRPTPTAIAVRLGSTPTTAPPSACVSSKSNCSFTSFTRKKWQRLSSSRFKARAATSCRRTCFTNASARSPPVRHAPHRR